MRSTRFSLFGNRGSESARRTINDFDRLLFTRKRIMNFLLMVFYSCTRQSVRDSLMVYRSGLLSIISHRSIVLSFNDTLFLGRERSRSNSNEKEVWSDRSIRSIGWSPFDIGRWKISVENAWKRGF